MTYRPHAIFKFSAAPESVWIFEQLGAEPWGRIASGVVELVVSVMLLVPSARSQAVAAVLGLGVMVGALGAHLLVLGVEVQGDGEQGDGGALFVMAVVVTLCALWVVWNRRAQVLELIQRPGTATL